jgi:formylglycine-generating enzyme required for sulfatase activity
MTSQPLHLRIFLSSPGDVADERGIALQLFDRLQYDPLLRGQVTIEAVAWDKPGADAPMLATMTPQEAINQGLPLPSQCDIVVVIFWTRMGTPLPPEYVKSDGTRYHSGTEWEYEDGMRASREKGAPQVLVYRRTERTPFFPDDPQFEKKLEQWQRVNAFFASFVNPDGSIRQGWNAYASPTEFAEKFETHLKTLIKRFIDEAEKRPPGPAAKEVETPPLWKGSPFPGLRAFTPEDAPIFFGRGGEADTLVKRVIESRLVAVVGASGSGKSSLVGAGLIPRLQANAIEGSKDWIVVSFTPGVLTSGDPVEALVIALTRNLQSAAPARNWTNMIHEQPDSLYMLIDQALADRPPWAEVLFFIDQFEELFSLVKPGYVEGFIDLLTVVVGGNAARIVLTVRADFYGRCVELPKLAALLKDTTYPLSAPEYGALYEMITRPAARAGLEYEVGLADRILRDTGTDPGALALMAYTLDELYKASADDKTLTHAEYESLGGVQGSIGERAESVFATLDADAQARLPDVFREICEVDELGVAIRRRSRVDIAARKAEARRLIDALTGARLLVQSAGEGGQPIVEVAHEALLRSWSRLAKWIEATQDDLRLLRQVRLGAEEWERGGRREEDLMTGTRLERATDWLDGHILDPLQHEYILTAVEYRKQQIAAEAWRKQELREAAERAEQASAEAKRNLERAERKSTEVQLSTEHAEHQRRRALIAIGVALFLIFTAIALWASTTVQRNEATYALEQAHAVGTQASNLRAQAEDVRISGLAQIAAELLVFRATPAAMMTYLPSELRWVVFNEDWSPVEQDFDGITMVLVPPGCFRMGKDSRSQVELQSYQICFDQSFWIDRTEVTQGDFARLGGQEEIINRNDFIGENRPLLVTNWFDAYDFCTLRGARLPTEAEWEYAARGPDSLMYPWGNEWQEDYTLNTQGYYDVGSKPLGVSWVGALDMIGGGLEWTNTIYDPIYFPYPYSPDDGREDTQRTEVRRVIRGQTHLYPFDGYPDTTWLTAYGSSVVASEVGFRCAR